MVKLTITRKSEVDAVYLRAECGVRYWDDGVVNGVNDPEDTPTIPFAKGDTWAPVIDIAAGKIVGWPEGTTASVHYKVCDEGRYTLLDAEHAELITIDGYVPDIMCPKEGGYGDYVIMDIGADGAIDKWKADLSAFAADDYS